MRDELRQTVRPGTEISVGIGQIGLLADDADQQVALTPALADARIEHRCLAARISADQHDRIGLLDAGDGRIEQIAGAAIFRMQRRAGIARIDVLDAERGHQRFQREHVLDRAELPRQGANLAAVGRAHLVGDQREGFLPRRRPQPAVLAYIRLIEALRAQAVDDMPRLVGNPLFVHVFIGARQNAHDFAAARVDADGGADRVHHVDRLGLDQFPGTGREGVGLGRQRADRAEIDDVRLQLRRHRLFEIGGDLHVLAASRRTEFGDAGDFRREANAARALDAAVHRGLDQRADIFVLDRALVFLEARVIDAISHRLVLQIALAALIANRAIQRVIDQQEFHHAFARLLHHRRFGEHHRRLAVRAWPQVAHVHGAGGDRLRRAALHFDQAHAAIAGDRQPFVEAEARDFRAGLLASLQQRQLRRYFDLDIVDDDFGHSNSLMLYIGEFEPALNSLNPVIQTVQPPVHAGQSFFDRRHACLQILQIA